MTTVAERITAALAPHVTEVFGLMGNGNAFLIDAMLRTGTMRYTAVRHEAATVASADAYHRVSRRIAVATTTYGAGFTNMLTPLADAAQSRVPLLVIAGDAPSGGMRPWDVDQIAMARAAGVATHVISAETPGETTIAALREALTGRPVVLAIPYDLPAREAGEEDEASFASASIAPEPVVPDPDLARSAADALLAAERPLILAGRGARHAAAPLRELADALGALTISSAPARGTFAGRELDLGVAGGFASERSLALTRQADVVLVAGAGLNQFTMAFGHSFSPGARIIQIDHAEAATHPAVRDFLRGDTELSANALLGRVREAGAAPRGWRELDPAGLHEVTFDREPGEPLAADGRLDPRSLTRELDRVLPENRLIVSDGGHFIGWANMYLRVPGPDSIVLVGTAYQSIGLGFPSAPGAATAAPDRTLVLVTGDGGGLMGLADLDSLIRTARSAVVVVYNDGAYTAEVAQYGTIGIAREPMMIREADFAALGRGLGAQGAVIRSLDDLSELEAWVQAGAQGTLVLDCRVSGDVLAPYMREIMQVLHGGLGRP